MARRADRIWPDVYFGRPGSLIKLPWPRDGIAKDYDREVFEFVTGSGQRQVSSLMGGSRLYELSWRALHTDNYGILERFWTGNAGVGPWALIDPSIKNMLLPNQASATSISNDTTGFYTSNGASNMGDLISNDAGGTTLHGGYNARSLRWYFSVDASAMTPVLNLVTPYRDWTGFPVAPGLSYMWSFWVKPDGVVDTAITVSATLTWYDSAGTQLSVVTGAATSVTAWTSLSAGGVAPAGAAFAAPRISVTGSTITTGASLYVDELMLEQDSVVNDWAPGTGIRPVEIVSLTDSVPFNTRFKNDISLSLRELAA